MHPLLRNGLVHSALPHRAARNDGGAGAPSRVGKRLSAVQVAVRGDGCGTLTIPHVSKAGICEDDDELRGVVRRALEREGFTVVAVASGSEAVRAFAADGFDVLVLDVGLPDADGRDVCQALRARGVATPVLFLTARDALPDRLSGFHAGGDDYLTKPFALAELLVRVQALVRRGAVSTSADAAPEGDAGSAASLRLDPAAHAVLHEDTRIPLTPTEFRLLAALAARPGEVVRRTTLVSAGWPEGAIVHDNTLDAYLARLRRKLRDAGVEQAIHTRRGLGYELR
jgi:two-component system OmpR family response regulator